MLLKREVCQKREQKGDKGGRVEEPEQQVKQGQGGEGKLSGEVGAGQQLPEGGRAGEEANK